MEGLESLEMHGFSGLEEVSGVIRGLNYFGSPIGEKVSDLDGLEGLESLEMHRFSGSGASKIIRLIGFSDLEAAGCRMGGTDFGGL